MAKFWAPIRHFLQSATIPGSGVSIEQIKDIAEAVKQDPGGTLIYEEPATKQEEGAPITFLTKDQLTVYIYYGVAAFVAALLLFMFLRAVKTVKDG